MNETFFYLRKAIYEPYKYHILGAFAFVTVLKYLKAYFGGGVCKSKVRLDGKTVIVTGANTGIGKETALECARRGARVIIACRDVKKGIRAAEYIRRESGNGNIVVEYLDLASFESIKKFAKNINAIEQAVDILINNAGLIAYSRRTFGNGIEMDFGVNHLGHFLLTILLLEKIKKSVPSRIVNVASVAHEEGRMEWNDIMFQKYFDPHKAYRQSKLANILFTRELAKRLKGTGVTAYSLHPGMVYTEIAREVEKYYGILYTVSYYLIYPLSWFVLKNCKQGAQTTVYCAIDESIQNESGKYYSDCKEKALLPHAANDDDALRLWELSEDLVKEHLI